MNLSNKYKKSGNKENKNKLITSIYWFLTNALSSPTGMVAPMVLGIDKTHEEVTKVDDDEEDDEFLLSPKLKLHLQNSRLGFLNDYETRLLEKAYSLNYYIYVISTLKYDDSRKDIKDAYRLLKTILKILDKHDVGYSEYTDILKKFEELLIRIKHNSGLSLEVKISEPSSKEDTQKSL